MSSVGVVISVYHQVRAAIATSHAAAAAAAAAACRPIRCRFTGDAGCRSAIAIGISL